MRYIVHKRTGGRYMRSYIRKKNGIEEPCAGNRMFTLVLPPATGMYGYELINMTGHIVLKNSMNSNQETITLDGNLAAGIYFLRVYENGNLYGVRGIEVVK